MIRKFLAGIGIILLIALLWYHKLIWYGIKQGKGQLSIVWNAREVEEVMKDPAIPDSIKQKLSYIEVVRNYAIDSLGLNDTENYTTYYDQQGKPLLWVVTGTRPFAFEPYEWRFPVVGTVPYKGYFDQEAALVEEQKIKALGFDTGIRTVGGWSTLGWFKDPVLSSMLSRSDGDLANVIIHELVHATIFVKDSVTFNENLASFIGDRGAERFMKDYYGAGSPELKGYQNELRDEERYANHILLGADKLGQLYRGFSEEDSLSKVELKTALINEVIRTTDTLNLSFPYNIRGRLEKEFPNNTYFMSFIRYREKQQDLESLFNSAFNGDTKYMIGELKKRHPYL